MQNYQENVAMVHYCEHETNNNENFCIGKIDYRIFGISMIPIIIYIQPNPGPE